MGSHDYPGETGSTFGSTYRRAIKKYKSEPKHDHLTLTCHDAIADVDTVPNSTDIEDWESILDLGNEYYLLEDTDYGKTSSKTDGSTGRDWVTDRIVELHEGFYNERLSNPVDQIEMITERLQDGLHGSSTNALVAQVFHQQDLESACVSRPNAQKMPCVTQVQFRPVKDKLHLHLVIRSQYLDLKGLGNLVSGGTLLATVAAETGYSPGTVVEHVHNATEYDSGLMNKIHRTFEVYEQRPVLEE